MFGWHTALFNAVERVTNQLHAFNPGSYRTGRVATFKVPVLKGLSSIL